MAQSQDMEITPAAALSYYLYSNGRPLDLAIRLCYKAFLCSKLLNMTTWQLLSQMRPPQPSFTANECPDQTGKVFIVTGGYSGVGFQLATILYQKNAKVYIAGRTALKAEQAIKEIKAKNAAYSSKGDVVFLFLDLNDLATIKPAVETFLSQEQRLDVLWNNAGVMVPPNGSTTKQGYEMQLGANSLAHFLLSRLLWPILKMTAKSAPKDSVRVCFAGSLVAELRVPKGVIDFDDINLEKTENSQSLKYGQSKAANILLGSEFARRHGDSGVLSVAFNPGNLRTELQRHSGSSESLTNKLLLYPPIYGAYTELYAGLSPYITSHFNGSYIIPWGRVARLKSTLDIAIKDKSEGGSGVAGRYYEWCEGEAARYM